MQLTDPLSHFEAAAAVDEAERKAALERRKSLANVLAAAAARWAVSEAFAVVHREAGVNDVAVMENRWQPMHTGLDRAPRPRTQSLRCCFIGGVAMLWGWLCCSRGLRAPCIAWPATDRGGLQTSGRG